MKTKNKKQKMKTKNENKKTKNNNIKLRNRAYNKKEKYYVGSIAIVYFFWFFIKNHLKV